MLRWRLFKRLLVAALLVGAVGLSSPARAAEFGADAMRVAVGGDNGASFGLMQMRVPYHCCYPLSARSTAFNVDYYAANLRATYDGLYGWLNTVPHGRTYRAGDLWGSVGDWYSGRWFLDIARYVASVREAMRKRTWATDPWF